MLIIVIWQLNLRWPDYKSIGNFFLIPLTLTTLAGIILGVMYHHRAWCYLCPVGTIGNIIGRMKKKLIIDANKCVDCKLCAKSCPMQIEPYKYKQFGEIKDGDCLICGKCITACPKEAIFK